MSCLLWRRCSLCVLLGIHSFWVDATCSGVLLSAVYAFECCFCPYIGGSYVFLCYICRSGIPTCMSWHDVIRLTTFTQSYFRWSSASVSTSWRQLPKFMPNFRKLSYVSVCFPSSSSYRLLLLLTVQPSFLCSCIVCAIVNVSGWLSSIRSVNCNVSLSLWSIKSLYP